MAVLGAGAVLAGVLALGAAPSGAHACDAVDALPSTAGFRWVSGQAMSGDGQRVVFADTIDPVGTNPEGADEVFVYDRAAPEDAFTQVTDGPSEGFLDGPWLSGDGQVVAYQRGSVVHRYDLVSEEDLVLFPEAEAAHIHGLDQTGDAVLAVVEDDGATGITLWHEGTETELGPRFPGAFTNPFSPTPIGSPSLSPDGAEVAVVHESTPGSGAYRLYLYDDDGTQTDVAAADSRPWVDLTGPTPHTLFLGTQAIIRQRTPAGGAATTVVAPRPDARYWRGPVSADGTALIHGSEYTAPQADAPALSPAPFGADTFLVDLDRQRRVPLYVNGRSTAIPPDVHSASADLRTLLTGIPTGSTILECGSFTDVPPSHPFSEEVEWAFAEQITDGYADGRFGVVEPVSRQAMAAFVHRFAGTPTSAPGGPSFADVDPDDPFYDAIEWAAGEGIVEGYADGGFHPLAPVTRQATAAFLHRLTGDEAPTLPPEPTFPDVAADHAFYEDVEWLAEQGITTGYDDGTFKPAATVTRQAMAAYLFRTNERS